MDNAVEFERKYTIKELPVSERPREKLANYGAERLSNAELIALIIRTGHRDDTALDVANRILSMDERGLSYLTNVSVKELTKIKGIGICKASQILASIEVGKRINRWSAEEKIKVTSPDILVNLISDKMRFLNKEHFDIAILDTKNQIISIENISIGTLNASIVHPRDVFYAAINKSANSIILIHNHPSGDPAPSSEDINITNRLKDAGDLIGIKVLDHIIIGDNRYVSFKEKNLI
ncbi:MAG: RadC family protein [Tissierella sp.]|uniref:RadC family protein n=1 Tax=Tissierella sp. TaxID=41274 RepID=UPI003F9C29A7